MNTVSLSHARCAARTVDTRWHLQHPDSFTAFAHKPPMLAATTRHADRASRHEEDTSPPESSRAHEQRPRDKTTYNFALPLGGYGDSCTCPHPYPKFNCPLNTLSKFIHIHLSIPNGQQVINWVKLKPPVRYLCTSVNSLNRIPN